MNTRTARPCIRAGRNSAFITQSLVGCSNPVLGLLTILTEVGSTRPVVSTIARSTTRPWIPACLKSGGETRGGAGQRSGPAPPHAPALTSPPPPPTPFAPPPPPPPPPQNPGATS